MNPGEAISNAATNIRNAMSKPEASEMVFTYGYLMIGGAALKNYLNRPLVLNDSVGGGQKLITRAREQLLNNASNKKFKNIINDLYRHNARVGSGSTADAIRFEMATGGSVGGKSHILKGIQYRTALINLYNSGTLNVKDLTIFKNILIDLQNSLSGY